MSRRQSIHFHITVGLADPDSGIVNADRCWGEVEDGGNGTDTRLFKSIQLD